ncbi:MAG: 50S ribosomal protein L11 methyltransferase [Holophagaceae bacterium]
MDHRSEIIFWIRHRVVAVDADCLHCIEELLTDNQLLQPTPQFTYFIGTLTDPRAEGPYDCIVANILLETIVEELPTLVNLLAPGGHLVISGISSSRTDEAAITLVLAGLQVQSIHTEGDWVALHARLH